MILWDAVPEGYFECYIDPYYGVVGLSRTQQGWPARIEGPGFCQTASTLYHTARDAKQWVEEQFRARCAGQQ